MKVKEYILVIREEGGIMHITGQFKVPTKINKDKELISGIAMHNAKAGDIVMVRI